MSDCVYIMGDSDYLMHHGIKGQKWGVENGPPYPLDPQKDYSKAEQKANAKALAKEYKKAKRKTMTVIGAANQISKNKIITDNLDYLKESRDNLLKAAKKLEKLPDNIGTEHPDIYAWEKASKEYQEQIYKLRDNILGEYGNIKVDSWRAYPGGKKFREDIKDRVIYSIQIAADRKFDPDSIYSEQLNDTLERIGY